MNAWAVIYRCSHSFLASRITSTYKTTWTKLTQVQLLVCFWFWFVGVFFPTVFTLEVLLAWRCWQRTSAYIAILVKLCNTHQLFVLNKPQHSCLCTYALRVFWGDNWSLRLPEKQIAMKCMQIKTRNLSTDPFAKKHSTFFLSIPFQKFLENYINIELLAKA